MLEIFAVFFVIFIIIFSYTWYRAHEKLSVHVNPGVETPVSKKLPYKDVSLKSSDGVKLAGWYIPVKDAKAVVILIHGFQNFKGGKSVMLSQAEYLYKAGYSTFLVDLRSMGYSEGNKVTLGINEWKDAVAAYDYVKSLPENKNKKVGFFGNSMGAVTSIIAVGIMNKGDFVIASVPYANFNSLFNTQISRQGLWPPLFLPFLRLSTALELGLHYSYYAPINWIGKIHVPIFLISAKHDGQVDHRDAKTLYDRANAPKEFWLANTGHDVYAAKPEEFKKRVLDFLSKI